MIPKELDAKFETLDVDSALRPTVSSAPSSHKMPGAYSESGSPLGFAQIIKTGDRWTKKSQKSLLSKLASSALGSTEQKSEKDKAFDLLDALSRSGALPIECAELHGAPPPPPASLWL